MRVGDATRMVFMEHFHRKRSIFSFFLLKKEKAFLFLQRNAFRLSIQTLENHGFSGGSAT
ncbi:MAG: hypothetical protein RL329_4126 [Bacteroidota bacterium]